MAVDGRFERAEGGYVTGWVWDSEVPERALEVRVIVDGSVVAHGRADLPDRSLAAAGYGDGAHVFRIPLPMSLANGADHLIGVIAGGRRFPVPTISSFVGETSDADSPWHTTRFRAATPADRSTEASAIAPLGADPRVQLSVSGAGHGFRGDLSALNISHLTVTIAGARCAVELGNGSVLQNVQLFIDGSDCRISVGPGCRLRDTTLRIAGDDCEIAVGDSTTIEGGKLLAHESGTSIELGRDCMLSRQIFIRTSDSHPIFDVATGERINPARSVLLGDHVWLGAGAQVGKGVTIGSGAIVGQFAVVTRDIEENVIAAGNPARVVRSGVTWGRELPGDPPVAY
jgi:acetyltransferase-like isoleucine patch superfamily enzyme